MGLFGNIEAGWKALKLWRWVKEGGLERMNWERLKSRKLWYTVASCLGVTAAKVQGAPPEAISGIAYLALNYLGAQTAVDLSGGIRDWKSRKLWISVAGSIAIYVLAIAGMDPGIIELVKWFTLTFVDGTAIVDITKARKTGGK